MNTTVSNMLCATKRLLQTFLEITFSKLCVTDFAVLRQFNYIIKNTCGVIYGITIKVYIGSNRRSYIAPY
jgi:hypothetical protein